MKRKVRTALMVILAAVCLGSCAMLAYQFFQYRQGDEVYAEAAELVELPDLSAIAAAMEAAPPSPTPGQVSADSGAAAADDLQQPDEQPEETAVWVDPYADALRNMDFAALRQVNSDVLGWIVIPNTNLSYPLLRGTDNEYYLNHTWRKGRNSVGGIFVDYRCAWDLGSFNTIVYGHRMNNNSMFGQLHRYQDPAYLQANPCVYIADDNGSHKYEIFAVYEAGATAGSNYAYMVDFPDDSAKQAFIDYCLGQSLMDTGVAPTVYDRILTLSTCTGRGHTTRWVVQAVLRGEAPADNAQERPAAETAGLPDGTGETPPEETGEAPADNAQERPAAETEEPAPEEGPVSPEQ